MTDTIWTPEFTRWYLGGAEVFFGIIWLMGAKHLRFQARNFKREIADPVYGERFREAIARRTEIENLSPVPWRIGGGVALALGLLTVTALASPVVSYAGMNLTVGVVMAYVFSRIRNRTERRAASLTPRSSTVAPAWTFVTSALGAFMPLAFIREFGATAIVVAFVSLLLVATAAFAASNMAAILTGDDAEIEAIVDERIRRGRVISLVIAAQGSAFIFMSIAVGNVHPLMPFQGLANLVTALSFTATMILFIIWFVKRERPSGKRFHVV